MDDIAGKTHLITHDSDAPASKRRCFVGVDNYACGRACGDLLREALPDGGKVALFVGRLEQENAQLRRQGVIDLATLQKYLNLHYSLSLDLFGSEVSTNAANYYTGGIKGRFRETQIDDDHKLGEAAYAVPEVGEAGYRTIEAPALNALNERLRDDFIADCQRGVDRWNKIIARHGIETRLTLPHRGFNRGIGAFSGIHVAPDGRVVGDDEWQRRRGEWLPGEDDRAYIGSLMKPVTNPGEMAHWIAAPARGVDGKAIDYEYVRLA